MKTHFFVRGTLALTTTAALALAGACGDRTASDVTTTRTAYVNPSDERDDDEVTTTVVRDVDDDADVRVGLSLTTDGASASTSESDSDVSVSASGTAFSESTGEWQSSRGTAGYDTTPSPGVTSEPSTFEGVSAGNEVGSDVEAGVAVETRTSSVSVSVSDEDRDRARSRVEPMWPLLLSSDPAIRRSAEAQLFAMGPSGRSAMQSFVNDGDRSRSEAAARLFATGAFRESVSASGEATAAASVRSGDDTSSDSFARAGSQQGSLSRDDQSGDEPERRDESVTSSRGDEAPDTAGTRDAGESSASGDQRRDESAGSEGARAPGGVGTAAGGDARPDGTRPARADESGSRAPGGVGTAPGSQSRPDQTQPGTAGGREVSEERGVTDAGDQRQDQSAVAPTGGAVAESRDREYARGYADGLEAARLQAQGSAQVQGSAAAVPVAQWDEATGIEWQPLPEGLRSHLRVAVEQGGIIVERVRPGSFADRLGLQRFDLLLSVNGKPVLDPVDVQAALDAKADDRITADVLRDGARRALTGKREAAQQRR